MFSPTYCLLSCDSEVLFKLKLTHLQQSSSPMKKVLSWLPSLRSQMNQNRQEFV